MAQNPICCLKIKIFRCPQCCQVWQQVWKGQCFVHGSGRWCAGRSTLHIFSNFPFLWRQSYIIFFEGGVYFGESTTYNHIMNFTLRIFRDELEGCVFFFRKSLRSYQAQLLWITVICLGPLRSELCRSGARAAQLLCLQQAWRFWGTKNGGTHRSVGELLQGGSLICQGISKSMIAKIQRFSGPPFWKRTDFHRNP